MSLYGDKIINLLKFCTYNTFNKTNLSIIIRIVLLIKFEFILYI